MIQNNPCSKESFYVDYCFKIAICERLNHTVHRLRKEKLANLAIRSQGVDSVQTTREKAACLHDATPVFDHEDNLDGQRDKQGNTRTDRAAMYGRSSDQKESPVNWTPHEDELMIRQTTKADSLSRLSSGHRKRGRHRLRFKDTIKRNLNPRDIKTNIHGHHSHSREINREQ